MQNLSKCQLLDLLTAARAANKTHWLMFLVGYWHGLRVSEIVSLQVGMVQDGFLTIQRLKGSLKTVQPLVSDDNPLLNEKDAIFEHIRGMDESALLFPVSRRQAARLMVRYAKQAKIPRHLAHMHVLKHSIAMHTIRAAGIENVKAYLGHKSIASTGAYLKVDDETASAAIRQAVK